MSKLLPLIMLAALGGSVLAADVPASIDDYLSGSILEWVVLQHASRALELQAASPYLVNSTFRDNVFNVPGESIGGAAILVDQGSAPRIDGAVSRISLAPTS